jgi:Inner membrane protein YgaP-like, transmembrane domain
VHHNKGKAEKPEWKFMWKNVDGLGRLNRLVAGVVIIYLATQNKEKGSNPLLVGFGAYLIVVGGLLKWCSLRALLKKPTRRAFLRHYPEAA